MKERTQAQAIVALMDGLPLALDQAGAYIEETGCSLSEYLDLYRSHRQDLLQRRGALPSDHPQPVAATWALSFLKVEQVNSAAADLLRLCAFLDPDAIPEAIVTEGAADLGPVLAPVAADPFQFNEAIQLLRHYSLVKRDPDAKLLNVHRLVQVVLKESMDQEIQRQWAERTVRAVSRAFPEGEINIWDLCELCLPHALLSAQSIEQYGFSFPEAARLLYAAGVYLRDRGQYTQAESLLKPALSLREQVLGQEHPDTANTLNTLAWLYVLQGNYQQAEQLVQPALANFESVLGKEHPEVATALNTLASLYMHEGKYVQAESLFQRELTIREKSLGRNHFLVAISIGNLALVYYHQGKYTQAEPLYQRTIALFENTLGSEHPDTLVNINNLAKLFMKQGRYVQAEPLIKRVLETQERVLGTEHPDTGMYLSALGQLYLLQGKYAQAEPLLQSALKVLKEMLGPEHQFTIRILYYLAQLLSSDRPGGTIRDALSADPDTFGTSAGTRSPPRG